MSSKKPWILYFDAHCVMCNWCLLFALKRTSAEQLMYAALEPEMLKENSVVLLAEDRRYTESKAIVKVLSILPGLYGALGSALSLVPSLVSDFVYRIVAKIRYRLFGRYSTCPMLSDEVLKREYRETSRG